MSYQLCIRTSKDSTFLKVTPGCDVSLLVLLWLPKVKALLQNQMRETGELNIVGSVATPNHPLKDFVQVISPEVPGEKDIQDEMVDEIACHLVADLCFHLAILVMPTKQTSSLFGQLQTLRRKLRVGTFSVELSIQ